MNTIHPRKKSVTAVLGAAIAAAAAPAVLFTGAGTAQAETQVVPFTDALGVSVHVVSVGPLPSSGWCSYTATPAIVPPAFFPRCRSTTSRSICSRTRSTSCGSRASRRARPGMSTLTARSAVTPGSSR